MKTFRLIPLLALAALAACADSVTAPVSEPATAVEADAVVNTGQGFMGGGTK